MLPLSWTALALLALLAMLLSTAAVTDLRRRDIANWLTLSVALLAVPWWFAAGLGGTAILWQLAAASLLFLLFAACFYAGVMGGGDVKLITGLALWLPLGALADLLIWMAIGGGVVTLLAVAHRRWRRAEGPIEVPYGVAIVGAAMLVLTNDILTTAAA